MRMAVTVCSPQTSASCAAQRSRTGCAIFFVRCTRSNASAESTVSDAPPPSFCPALRSNFTLCNLGSSNVRSTCMPSDRFVVVCFGFSIQRPRVASNIPTISFRCGSKEIDFFTRHVLWNQQKKGSAGSQGPHSCLLNFFQDGHEQRAEVVSELQFLCYL